jgi:DNA repair protein RadA/Sms
MNAKHKISYQCSACGALHPKWNGQCADCGAWNTLNEIVSTSRPAPRFSGYSGESAVQALSDVDPAEHGRTCSGIGELDRALGGGIVRGSVVLIGGDPGIGKSTLLLQLMGALNHADSLYVSGEESAQQTSLRARRLGLSGARMLLLTETCVERILAEAAARAPKTMVVDSIQTLYTEQLQSAPGSVAQVRECAAQLVRHAKQSETTIFLVGHVTKEGALAGPRVLEHMVDTVLYFEGDAGGRYRVLRAVKNRFGAINELGVFAMSDKGLIGVNNPSAIFLSRHEAPVPGSVIMVTREGTRPMLVEVQALVDESHIANPRRVAVGLDYNRLGMLLAVLHRHGGVAMYDQDVFVNAVGGMRINETGADLAVLMAALSSFRDKPLPADLIVFGEIGLAGEIRPVPNGQERLKEAAKHGFKRAIIPKDNLARRGGVGDMQVMGARRLSEAMEAVQ